MNRKSKAGNNTDKGESDWKNYQDFLRLWSVGNLNENNPVYRKVENWSLKICWSNKRPDEIMDVCHTCLVALGKGLFKKGDSLDDYIGSIMRNEVISVWRLTVNETAVMAAPEPPSRTSRILEEVVRRMNSEANMRRMVASRLELQLDIVGVVLACDHYAALSPNKAVNNQSFKRRPGSKHRIAGRLRGLFGRYR